MSRPIYTVYTVQVGSWGSKTRISTKNNKNFNKNVFPASEKNALIVTDQKWEHACKYKKIDSWDTVVESTTGVAQVGVLWFQSLPIKFYLIWSQTKCTSIDVCII